MYFPVLKSYSQPLSLFKSTALLNESVQFKIDNTVDGQQALANNASLGYKHIQLFGFIADDVIVLIYVDIDEGEVKSKVAEVFRLTFVQSLGQVVIFLLTEQLIVSDVEFGHLSTHTV